MSCISFFTPIVYKHEPSSRQNLLQAVDHYFYLGGRKAYVLPGQGESTHEKVTLVSSRSQVAEVALKVVSYCTLILPLILLAAKCVLRSGRSFHVAEKIQLNGQDAYRKQIACLWKLGMQKEAIGLLKEYCKKFNVCDVKALSFDCHKKSVEFVLAYLLLWVQEGGDKLLLITGVGYHSKHPLFHMQNAVIQFLKDKNVTIEKVQGNLGRLQLIKKLSSPFT